MIVHPEKKLAGEGNKDPGILDYQVRSALARNRQETRAVVIDWDRIVREHGSRVFVIAWRILGHAADAEDVVQDVFLEAYDVLRLEPVRHWAGFLRRLATFRALDRLRQRKTTVSFDGLTLTSPCAGPDEAAIGRELAERLRQAIAQLPQREGAVFCLRYFDDHSYQQIAEILKVSPGAVATALHKARTRLESLLTEVAQGEEP